MPVQRGSLSIAVQDFIDRLKISERVTSALEKQADKLEAETSQIRTGWFKGLENRESIRERIRREILDVEIDSSILKFIVGLLQSISEFLGAGAAAAQPTLRELTYAVEVEVRSARPDPATAVAIGRRIPNTKNRMSEMLAQTGWSDDLIEAFSDIYIQQLTGFELMAAWRRGAINKSSRDKELSQQGWRSNDIDTLESLTEQIPGVQDLIRMAVREAFNEEVVARFGLDVNFPQDVVPFAEQQGLSRFWVKNFWRAHWQLPSFTQGAEMFQRLRQGRANKVFTREDLRVLMRANDIPDYFVDRLIEIAYNPPTRIDIRRMQQKGMIDFVEAAAMLQDTGYSPEMAKRLAELGIDEDDPLELQVSRDALLRGFKKGYLKREETIQLMLSVGMTKRSVDFWINLAEFDLAIQERDEEVEQLKILFIEGQISDIDALTALNSLGIVGDEQKTYMLQWQRTRKAKIGLPTRSDLEDWYKKGISDPTGFREGMKERNYRDRDIDKYLRSMDEEVSERERKELERAQKEQERLETASQRNQYQIRLAQLDVRIAETKLAIANTKIALSNTEDPSEAEELSARLESLQIDIIEYQRDKARVKLSKEQSEA